RLTHPPTPTIEQRYCKRAQLNFPHLYDSFILPDVTFSVAAEQLQRRDQQQCAASCHVDYFLLALRDARTPGRQDEAEDADEVAEEVVARRKVESDSSASSTPDQSKTAASGTSAKRYLGVPAHRVYARAQIHVNGKIVNLGSSPRPRMDAAMTYDKAALKHFGGTICASDARHDQIVLDSPEQRADMMKPLI
ncbi:hypothetical protein BBJ28_00026646, partial [Nothophytophthora sp. Chile5]